MSLSAEQHAIRATGIGSSDIAGILGEDPFKSPLDVWLDKTGRASREGTLQTRMGQRSEEVIADEFAEKYGVQLVKCTTLRHLETPWIVATPDRRIVGRDPIELVECKRVGYRMLARWHVANDVYVAPPYVQIQGTWQCLVEPEAPRGFWVAADIGGRDWYDEFFAYDAELADGLVGVAGRFWRDHVIADVAPDAGSTASARAYFDKKFARANGRTMPSTEEVERHARAYATHQRAESASKRLKDAAGTQLRSLLGEFEACGGPWGRVTWKAPARGRVSWEQVARAAGAGPDLIAAHTAAPSRAMRVKFLGLEDDTEETGS